MDNRNIAQQLKAQAKQLEAAGDNIYRIKAYRRAAAAIQQLDTPVGELLTSAGTAELRRQTGIGAHIAFAIERLVNTGDFHTLTEAAGEVPPGESVRHLPGVGPHLAQHLWEQLGIQSVAQLEKAVATGAVQRLALGEKRTRQLLAALDEWKARREQQAAQAEEPTVAELLAVDEEYRRQAEQHTLPTIAPFQNNPDQEPWLPILSLRRDGWRYRALYSNTALAHRLGQARDWVVIYFQRGTQQGQRTIVTEQRGDLRGRRVVRGREEECRQQYRK